MLPRLSSYFLADGSAWYQWTSGLISGIPFRHEHQMFFGSGVWILAISGVYASCYGDRNKYLGKVALLSVAILAGMTLSVHGYSLYKLIAFLPGISQLRAVSRIVLVMLVPISILVAIGIEHWVSIYRNAPQLRKGGVFVLLTLLVSAESFSFRSVNTEMSLWNERQTLLKEKLPENLPDTAILYVSKEESEPFYLAELDAVVLAQDLGLKTLNGYSGSFPPGWMKAEPCYSHLNRLNGYAEHRKATANAMEQISKKVVTVAYTACDQELVVASSGRVTSDLVQGVTLSLDSIKPGYTSLSANVLVRNASSQYLNTLSSKGAPIRLSWRFIRVTELGGHLDNPGFTKRKNLLWSLAPNTEAQTSVQAELPTKPGDYLFEVTLVQDGVAWFHHLGMKVASFPITIKNERSSAPISSYQAENIQLEIKNAQLNKGSIFVDLNLSNHSNVTLNSAPVRFSWRFVGVSSLGIRTSVPGWDARKDIEWPVPSNSSNETQIMAKLPTQKGKYYFEVTLVQEGVAWLHDLGMTFASIPIVIK
jgi:hypothetical protein